MGDACDSKGAVECFVLVEHLCVVALFLEDIASEGFFFFGPTDADDFESAFVGVLEIVEHWRGGDAWSTPGCPEVEDKDFAFEGAFVIDPIFVAHWNGEFLPLVVVGMELSTVVVWPRGFVVGGGTDRCCGCEGGFGSDALGLECGVCDCGFRGFARELLDGGFEGSSVEVGEAEVACAVDDIDVWVVVGVHC